MRPAVVTTHTLWNGFLPSAMTDLKFNLSVSIVFQLTPELSIPPHAIPPAVLMCVFHTVNTLHLCIKFLDFQNKMKKL